MVRTELSILLENSGITEDEFELVVVTITWFLIMYRSTNVLDALDYIYGG